jgi:hypothetical protein
MDQRKIREYLRKADEHDALKSKVASFEEKARADREAGRRAWVSSMVNTGRLHPAQVGNVLDLLRSAEEYDGGGGLVIRSYQRGTHQAMQAAEMLRTLVAAYPEGIHHASREDERLYADPVGELDARAAAQNDRGPGIPFGRRRAERGRHDPSG